MNLKKELLWGLWVGIGLLSFFNFPEFNIEHDEHELQIIFGGC